MVVRAPDEPENRPDFPVIFLAGPIQGAPDWQTEAIELAGAEADYCPFTVASPRRDYELDELTFVYGDQVDWETRWLARAAQRGCILFWLAAQGVDTPGRSYGQTTRFELGEWFARAAADPTIQLAVGADPAFGNVRYIRRRLGQTLPHVPVHDTLADTVKMAQALAVRP